MSRGGGQVAMWVFLAASAFVSAWVANMAAQWADLWLSAALSGAEPPAGALDFLATRLSASPLGISFELWHLLASLAALLAIAAIASSAARDATYDDPRMIHGTSRWATREEMDAYAHLAPKVTFLEEQVGRGTSRIRKVTRAFPKPPYVERLEDDNYILSRTARLSFSKHPDFNHEKSKHVMVIGGTGAGKTFNYVTPNILNCNSSLVFTDLKGEILRDNANLLRKHGYEIYVLGLRGESMFRSFNRYNPLARIKTPSDIEDIVKTLMDNTDPEGAAPKEPYFRNAERQLYLAIIGYLHNTYAETKPWLVTFNSVYDMLAYIKADGRTGKSVLDRFFFAERETDGISGYREMVVNRHHGSVAEARGSDEWFPISCYEGFTSTRGAEVTVASVISSCYVRMTPFAMPGIRAMFSGDEFDFPGIGERKCAVFLEVEDKGTYNWVAAMFVSQLFETLKDVGESSPGGHLKVPVCFYLDELAQIGKIPNLQKRISLMRSYWVNIHVILQSEGQLAETYGKEAEEIIRTNCATYVYLGGSNDQELFDRLEKQIGSKTVKVRKRSESWSAQGKSVSLSDEYVSVPVMRASDIANALRLDPDDPIKTNCLVHIDGAYWYLDRKANPMTHPRWKERQQLGPFDSKRFAEELASKRQPAPDVYIEPVGSGGIVVGQPPRQVGLTDRERMERMEWRRPRAEAERRRLGMPDDEDAVRELSERYRRREQERYGRRERAAMEEQERGEVDASDVATEDDLTTEDWDRVADLMRRRARNRLQTEEGRGPASTPDHAQRHDPASTPDHANRSEGTTVVTSQGDGGDEASLIDGCYHNEDGKDDCGD